MSAIRFGAWIPFRAHCGVKATWVSSEKDRKTGNTNRLVVWADHSCLCLHGYFQTQLLLPNSLIWWCRIKQIRHALIPWPWAFASVVQGDLIGITIAGATERPTYLGATIFIWLWDMTWSLHLLCKYVSFNSLNNTIFPHTCDVSSPHDLTAEGMWVFY